ncbi:TMEM175 family protein [Dyella solisilvae]|nr:TMEM175 family protein [Dyella solisilvae]
MTQDEEVPEISKHLDRLVLLSDGVFAIAITLSAIEIHPELTAGITLWQAWGPPLLTYFVSFLLIGVVWLMHRRMLAYLRHIDGPGTLLNLLVLSLVALVPVVVRFWITHPEKEGGVLVYAVAFAVLYTCLALSWGYLAFIARLAQGVTREAAMQLLAKQCFVVAAFAAMAMYQLGWMIPAVLFAVAAVPLRWLAWRYGRGGGPAP